MPVLSPLWLGKEAGFHVSSKVCDPVQIEPVLQVQEQNLEQDFVQEK